MGKTHSINSVDASSVWLPGFTPDLFLAPPSTTTQVAQVAQQLSQVVYQIESVPELDMDSESVEPPSQEGDSTEMVQAWQDPVDPVSDLADRRPSWPAIDPAMYRPAQSEEERIRDNLKAIALLGELRDTKREITEDDRIKLLKYCGWGGLSRIFTPDGSSRHSWSDYRDELQGLVSEEDFADMRSSITTAYYTNEKIVQAAWNIVRRLGFEGGRIIEPGAGVGHFLAGMPADIADKSDVTAVEIDPVSAAILEANFGPLGVQVNACALERARLPVAFFDLVIGNVPFGNFKSVDTSSADYSNWSIHNYFIGRSVDLVRPGGLIVLITSRHTLDSNKNAHRRWLSAHAKLLAAYRLPTMAFKQQANTEAVTDILVLQRREVPDYMDNSWLSLAQAKPEMLRSGQETTVYQYGQKKERDRSINEYFVGEPKNVLGLLTYESTQYSEALNPVFDGSITELATCLQRRIDVLPEGVYQHCEHENQTAMRPVMQRYNLENFISPGAILVREGRICVSEGEELLDIDAMYSGTSRKRILGMLEVKQLALRVIEHQTRSDDDTELARLQRMLTLTYDAFVASFGYLSANANSRLMRSDPDWPLMLALEIWDDEDQKATKADIFSRRTVGHRKAPERVDNVKDAMLISLALYGRIELRDIVQRTGKPVMSVVKEFKEKVLAFRDPQLARWVPADEYLSGHIRDKIASAKAAGPAYAENIPALTAVLPKDLGPADVDARLGAPWIPVDVVTQFAKELINDTRDEVSASYETKTATWSIKSHSYRPEFAGDRTLQVSKWGTKDRCALTLLEAALNQQPPTVMRTVDQKQVVDRMATLAAREKWQSIRDEFKIWVYRDEARRDRLLRIYNDEYNQIVNRRFDGSHLILPGLSDVVTPYPHQKDAIWRIMVNGNTLLGHPVGAGKTLEMCAASMELRRLGKAAKPLHVVQNSTLEQYTAEFVRLYPHARVLMASKDDLHGDNRRAFAARIATGDWDAVVMTQSTFERLMLAPDTQRAFIRSMLDEARMAAGLAEDGGAKRSLKEIEKRMKDYQAKIERLADNPKGDADCVWFDELGVDYIFYDEAHALKNLGRISKMPRMAGLANVSSQRSFDFFMKSRVLMQKRGDEQEGLVLATATFLTNSLAEMHTFQVYLQPQTLRRHGLYEFDAWSASFGESVTGIELAPDGSGYRMNTRYCRFVNLPELMSIFREVADIKTKRMLNLPVPKIKGGKPQTMVAKPSEALLGIVAALVDRADAVRARQVKPNEDNMLLITNDGRKAAMDVRIIDPSLPRDPGGKLSLAADNMVRIWQEGHATRATQLVFSDLGTPGCDGFSVYEEIKDLLIQKGVPPEQIEFVQDHNTDKAKAKLFRRVREGMVRFLLGSTQMMGTGTNIQTRLKAIHQLDAPWVPSSVEQRDGRGERQGNLNEEIELWRYVTEKSFDAYSWNLLTVKANFIEQVMTAESGLRTVEDISMSALTYAEIKAIASGNPLVLEKATVDAQVQKLLILRSQWEDDRWRMSRRESELSTRMAWIDSRLVQFEADAKLARQALKQPLLFKPTTTAAMKAVAIHGDGAMGLAAALRAQSSLMQYGGGHSMGTLSGFDVSMERSFDEIRLQLTGPNSMVPVRVDRPRMNDLAGMESALLAALTMIGDAPQSLREEYGRKTEELATIRRFKEQEFEHAAQLQQLLQRQHEIENQLDLDKDQVGTQDLEAETA